MSAGTVTLASPLNAGSSINLRFLFGVQQQGKYNFCAVIETAVHEFRSDVLLRKHGAGGGKGR